MRVLITGAKGQLGKEFEFLQDEFKNLSFEFVGKDELDICDEKAVCEFLGAKCEKNSQSNAKCVNSTQNLQNSQLKNLQACQNESKEKNSQKFTKSVNLSKNSDFNELNLSEEKLTPKFDAVINCAAYTAVDKAESEQNKAFAINERGVLNLAKACKQSGIKLVHISTDYVFDGKFYSPIAENAPTAPLGVYGASKLAGEKAILSVNLRHSCIIRTSWLYGEFGSNFVQTIAKLAQQRDEISVVSDQIGSPTNARDLARAICKLLPSLDKIKGTEIFHYANEGVSSWFDFACEIVRLSGAKCLVKPISTDNYKAMNEGKIIAPRPFYSVFDKSKIRAFFDIEIMQWKESLSLFFDTFNANLSK